MAAANSHHLSAPKQSRSSVFLKRLSVIHARPLESLWSYRVSSACGNGNGRWHFESPEHIQEIADGSEFNFEGKRWRFQCPRTINSTVLTDGPSNVRAVEHAKLHFNVSRNEEYVEVVAHCHDDQVTLKYRTAYYMLLTLARHREADKEPSDAGWIHTETLADMLKTDRTQINVWVFRIRDSFAKAGFFDAGRIIERRAGTGQLRIGVADNQIAYI